jgi:A/G-specific adenine glycosylase
VPALGDHKGRPYDALLTESRASHPNPSGIRRALLAWFERHARPLPWRQSKDPYAVWVSEVMLQQTQVDTVVPFFRRFLGAFPNIKSVAEAPRERVLELWSGLGYYRRAGHLHRAAQKIMNEFGGVFPSSYREVRSLPGVGDYTARAVLSIACNQPYAVVDGNVARVVSRLRTLRGNLHRRQFRCALDEELELILSRRQPGNFNQAIMELGQSICLPRAPKCHLCPLRSMCQAYRDGSPEAYPEARPRRPSETRYLATVVLCRADRSRRRPLGPRTHMTQGSNAAPSVFASNGVRPQAPKPTQVALGLGLDDGLMDGLWNFPSAFGSSPGEALSRLQARIRNMTASKVKWKSRSGLPRPLAQLRHVITYRSIFVDVYWAEVTGNNRLHWFTTSRLARSAVSSLTRKIGERIGLFRTPAGDQEREPGLKPVHFPVR